jgi:hypothetical protein
MSQALGDLRGGVAIASGGALHSWGIDQIHFCMPWHCGSNWYRTDGEVLSALGRLLKRPRRRRQCDRIFRALEWFRLSHTGSDEVSDQSRVVMMATAFEVLLEPVERHRKRQPMMQKLHSITASARLKDRNVRFGKSTLRLNMPAVWLGEFYDLRNAIVHGGVVSQRRMRYQARRYPWLTYLHVADLVLWEAILWELIELKLLAGKARRHAIWLSRQFGKVTAEPAFVRQVQAGAMGINVEQYHEDLGWVSRKSSSA